jgi:predicted Zn-dependent protease
MAALLASGCAVNPVSGRPELSVVSEARERELGAEEARRVVETMGLLDDAALVAYVRAVGERLVLGLPANDTKYTFSVVDMDQPNAFALPGGYVYVSRGLLALLNSEDELAGVVGHEIGHVAARHAVQRATRAAPLAVLTGLGAAVTGIVSPALGGLVGGIGDVAGALVLAPYSRGQEEEADRVGQELAAKAGWDAAGLSRALRSLEREEALHGGKSRGMSFFATHPPLPRRVADTEGYARTLERGSGTPIARGETAFLRKLEDLPVGPRAADGVFEGETFLHPDLAFHVRFPRGWKTANTRTIVGATAPDEHAVVGLESLGEGSDPEAALRALEREAKVDLSRDAERFTINGLPAVRTHALARSREGPVALDLTWIAYRGKMYRFTGAARPDAADAARPAFRETAKTFGPISTSERARVREARLRIVAARAGETLRDVVARTNATWSVEMAAAANALEPSARLDAGRLVKVPVMQPYSPAAERTAGDGPSALVIEPAPDAVAGYASIACRTSTSGR